MKKVLGFLLVLSVLVVGASTVAYGSQASEQTIVNDVWDDTTNTLGVKAIGGIPSPTGANDGDIAFSAGGAYSTSANVSYDYTTQAFELNASNVTTLSINDNIETAIASATAGDTISLASGTYTVTDDIDITKAINIVGQGVGKTTIVCATGSKNMLHITASNVRLAGMTLTNTGTVSVCINVDGTAGAVLSGIVLEDLVLSNVAANATMGQCILVQDASGTARNIIASSEATAEGYINAIQFSKLATCESNISWDLYNVETLSTGITTAVCSGLGVVAAGGAAGNIYVTAYDCTFACVGGTTDKNAVYLTAATSTIDLYGCTLNGDNYDAKQTSGTLTLYNTTLVNGTTSGTITYGGYTVSKNLAPNVSFTKTISTPLNLAEADTFPIWKNRSGENFVITAIYSDSDTDDTDFTLKSCPYDDYSTLSTIEAITIDTNGTNVFYDDLTSGIDDATVESGEVIVFDADATDDPDYIGITIVGYYE